MWASVDSNNNVVKVFARPKPFIHNGIKHPTSVFNQSRSFKQSIGLYDVVFDETNKKNSKYYTNTSLTFAVDGDVVKGSYGPAIAKDLVELKEKHKIKIKQEAAALLKDSDWYVIRKQEDSTTSIPSNISTFRSAVRTKSNEMEAVIDSATDVDDLASKYVYTQTAILDEVNAPTGEYTSTRPLGEWPELLID